LTNYLGGTQIGQLRRVRGLRAAISGVELGNCIARRLGGGHIARVKVLFNCGLPFALAHGGQAIQIQQTMAALQAIGVAVEPMRWWDEGQAGDLIHYFGRMPAEQIRFAHQKRIRVIMGELLTGAGSQTNFQRLARRIFRWGAENLAPQGFAAAFQWESYQLADGFIAQHFLGKAFDAVQV
jgi:hypothetical protein